MFLVALLITLVLADCQVPLDIQGLADAALQNCVGVDGSLLSGGGAGALDLAAIVAALQQIGASSSVGGLCNVTAFLPQDCDLNVSDIEVDLANTGLVCLGIQALLGGKECVLTLDAIEDAASVDLAGASNVLVTQLLTADALTVATNVLGGGDAAQIVTAALTLASGGDMSEFEGALIAKLIEVAGTGALPGGVSVFATLTGGSEASLPTDAVAALLPLCDDTPTACPCLKNDLSGVQVCQPLDGSVLTVTDASQLEAALLGVASSALAIKSPTAAAAAAQLLPDVLRVADGATLAALVPALGKIVVEAGGAALLRDATLALPPAAAGVGQCALAVQAGGRATLSAAVVDCVTTAAGGSAAAGAVATFVVQAAAAATRFNVSTTAGAVELLLEAGATLNLTNAQLPNALALVMEHGATLLLGSGASDASTALRIASLRAKAAELAVRFGLQSVTIDDLMLDDGRLTVRVFDVVAAQLGAAGVTLTTSDMIKPDELSFTFTDVDGKTLPSDSVKVKVMHDMSAMEYTYSFAKATATMDETAATSSSTSAAAANAGDDADGSGLSGTEIGLLVALLAALLLIIALCIGFLLLRKAGGGAASKRARSSTRNGRVSLRGGNTGSSRGSTYV